MQGLDLSCAETRTPACGDSCPDLSVPRRFRPRAARLRSSCQSQLPLQVVLSSVTGLGKACLLPTHRSLKHQFPHSQQKGPSAIADSLPSLPPSLPSESGEHH